MWRFPKMGVPPNQSLSDCPMETIQQLPGN